MTTMQRAASVGLPLLLGLSTLLAPGTWWRAHAGDAFIAAFLVGVLGLATKRSLAWRIACVALLCTAVECAQLLPGATSRSGAQSLLLGATFDPLDLAWYGIGLGVAWLLGHPLYREKQCRRTRGVGYSA